MSDAPAPKKLKPITEDTIPGTDVPDLANAGIESERAKKWMSRVAVSTAVMAAGAAISTSFSGGHLNQAMFEQIKAADAWNHYQSKGIKKAVMEERIALTETLGKAANEKDRKEVERYAGEQKGLETDAGECQKRADNHVAKYKIMGRAATALQIGIALTAIALLLRRNVYWGLALAAGAVGTVFLVLGLL